MLIFNLLQILARNFLTLTLIFCIKIVLQKLFLVLHEIVRRLFLNLIKIILNFKLIHMILSIITECIVITDLTIIIIAVSNIISRLHPKIIIIIVTIIYSFLLFFFMFQVLTVLITRFFSYLINFFSFLRRTVQKPNWPESGARF